MRQNNVLLSFLPGFAPILVYIAVDSLFGETAGLAAGVALGLGEFMFILARERRVDAFSLADTVLLVAMGALSWALSNPVYFRLKPAVSGGVLALMMIVGVLGPHRFFLPYLERKSGLHELPKAAVKRMTAMVAGFGFLVLAHSALTAAAALWWSKSVWNFIAGALFWILSFLYILAWTLPALVIRFRAGTGRAANAADVANASNAANAAEGAGEILPVVDPEGRVVGKAPRPLCHAGGARPLHPVVRLWLTDGSGNFWMQKRSRDKLVQPGKWDCAVGGHVAAGEILEAALRREAREEIGLTDPGSLTFIAKFIWETAIERELVFVFLATLPRTVSFLPDRAEVDEIRLWSGAELADAGLDSLTELALRELASIPGLSPR